ncbi:uncharacterized protein LOC143057957 isoform X2 [Mytilus galloprovincialis]|uniref:uncharacterized protein LOC143057957 isoform X2 n=1 Tax=Mytilus galloprovincialis TaxID=29158 RepID=UPI003F7B47C0
MLSVFRGMKVIFSKLIQNYEFSPQKYIFGGLVFLALLDYNACNVSSSPSYERDGKLCYYCSPGFYWVGDCWQSHTQALCQPCAEGFFQTTSNIAHYCATCKSCQAVVRNFYVAKVLSLCTSRSDTICGCMTGYHFIKDHGGNGHGYCQLNQMCSVGYGLVENGTHFKDTTCTACIQGYTYSPSESLDPCLECDRKCPNHTHMLHPCNSTHNIECVPNKHLGIPVKENTETKSSVNLAIGLGCGGAVLVVLIIACICILVKRRTNMSTARHRTFRNPSFRTTFTPLLKSLMGECLQDDNRINWQKFFNLFQQKIDVLPDWEHFIRTLFKLFQKRQKTGIELSMRPKFNSSRINIIHDFTTHL